MEQQVSLLQKRRISVMRFFFLSIIAVIIGKFFYVQVIQNSHYVVEASKQQWALDTMPAKRGVIYVEDSYTGELYPLATNQYMDMIFATPGSMEDKDMTAFKLANIIEMEKDEILAMFDTSDVYVRVKRQLTADQSAAIENLDLAGVYLREEEWRYYPEGSMASQILGYVNDEGDGQYGIEGYLNELLRGIPGIYKAQSDIEGRKIAFGDDISKEAIDGENVVLTINRDVQYEAEKILKEAVEKYKAESGSLIVMDPKTGKVIAMTNQPDFDPNIYKDIEEKDYEVFKNKAVTDNYEPGSIMKAITMAAGIDSEAVTPDETYEDKGVVVLDGHKIQNSDKKAHGERTMTQVLEDSLNTGMVYVLNQMGNSTFFKYLKKFGFGERTGIESDEEAQGNVLWDVDKDHTVATMSFGQSISATPLQMITAFASIANGGVMMRPQLVEKTIDKDGNEKIDESEEIGRVISEKAAASMTSMLVSVVENGHGGKAKVKGYKVAGKTGTAQVPKEGGLGYDTSKNIVSFVGLAPALDPEFVVMVKLDHPEGRPWADATATPTVGKMIDYLLKYFQVPPSELDELD